MGKTMLARYRDAMTALDGLRLAIPVDANPMDRYLVGQLFTARNQVEWFCSRLLRGWLVADPVAAARAGVPEALAEFSGPPEVPGAGVPAPGEPFRIAAVGALGGALMGLAEAIPMETGGQDAVLLLAAVTYAGCCLQDYTLSVAKLCAGFEPTAPELFASMGMDGGTVDALMERNSATMERMRARLLPALEDGDGGGVAP